MLATTAYIWAIAGACTPSPTAGLSTRTVTVTRLQCAALAALAVFTEAVHPYFYVHVPARRAAAAAVVAAAPVLPFLPLLLTSCVCAALLLGCWVEAGRLVWTGAGQVER